jgi:hypothetical protein
MSLCSNPTCRASLAAATRSTHDPHLCATCGAQVWAFRPSSSHPDHWYLASERPLPIEGEIVEGDQCEGCGLCEYVLRLDGRWTWVAVCEGMDWDGDHLDGCGARHPVRQRPAWTVL